MGDAGKLDALIWNYQVVHVVGHDDIGHHFDLFYSQLFELLINGIIAVSLFNQRQPLVTGKGAEVVRGLVFMG